MCDQLDNQDPRKTGISAVGDMPWGTHFCHFYETKKDLLEILVPYFQAGLENNEFCLWVMAAPLGSVEATHALRKAVPDLEHHLARRSMEIQVIGDEAANALRKAIPNLDQHLSRRSIEVIPHNQWYLKDGIFGCSRVIKSWKLKLDEALARGYTGMRVHGNEAWLTDRDWGDFLRYERRLNSVLAGKKMLVLCTYPLCSRKAGEVFDVAQAHEFAIAKRNGRWEMLETPELKHARTELEALRRAEQGLRESRQLLQLVLATLPVGVAVTDRAGDIILTNAASKRIWGDIIVAGRERWKRSKGFWHDSGKRVAPANWASVRALTKGETSLNELIDIQTYKGERKTIQNSAAPIRNAEGLIVGVVIVNEDVTERVRAEEALRQAQTELARVARWTILGELTASIAHEINQPLAGVVTNANACLQWLAARKPNIAEARKAVRRIARDGTRAGEVIKRIRALLQKDAPVRTPVNINHAVRGTISLVEHELHRRAVKMRTALAPDLPRVPADRVQLQQVIMNLILNAMEALDEVTERRRVIRIRTAGAKSGLVRVEVRDSGVGIDPRQAKRLFEPFFSTKPNGLGLGLVISRSIVEAHGGRLWATRNRGPGMTFQFTLPIRNGGSD